MVQFALTKVTEAATREGSGIGLAFLRDDLWREQYFPTGLRGYTRSLGGGVNWRRVRSSLLEIVDERAIGRPDPEGKSLKWERQVVDQVVAEAWARRDVDAAVRWYSEQESANGQPIDRALTVLITLPLEDRDRAVRWLERSLGSGVATDELVVRYAQRFGREDPGSTIQRLIQVPMEEANRVRILSHFALPRKNDKTREAELRYSPESLRQLIDAAQLSEGEQQRWHTVVNETNYPPKS